MSSSAVASIYLHRRNGRDAGVDVVLVEAMQLPLLDHDAEAAAAGGNTEAIGLRGRWSRTD